MSFRYALWTSATLVALFLALPLVIIAGASVTTTPYVTFPPVGFTLDWYRALLARGDFLTALRTSILLGVHAASAALALGVPAALALRHPGLPGRALLRGLLMAPLTVPTIVTAVALLQFYYAIDLDAPLIGLLIGHTLICVPYAVRGIGAALEGLDPDLANAAASLGARPFIVHWRITLPALLPSVLAAFAIMFVTSFDQVTLSVFLAGPEVVPLPVRLYTYIEFAVDPMLAAASASLIVLAVVVVALGQRLLGMSRGTIGTG